MTKTAPTLDARGREIVVGSKVVFNFSGDLALGEVILVDSVFEKNEWNPYLSRYKFNIHVRLVEDVLVGYRKPAGHISKVKNPKGVIVLDDFPTRFVN